MKKAVFLMLTCLLISLLSSCVVSILPEDELSPTPEAVETQPPSAPPESNTPAPAPTEEPIDTPDVVTSTPSGVTAEVRALAAYVGFSEKLTAPSGSQSQLDMDMAMEISLSAQGESMVYALSGNIKMKDDGGGKIAYALEMDMSDFGIGMMEIYSDGDRIYSAINGVEQKLEMSDLDKQLDSLINLPEFSEDDMISTEIETVGGDIETTIVVDGGQMSSYIMGALESMMGSIGEGMSFDISDIVIVLLTDSAENPKSMRMEMDMSMSIEGETADMSMKYLYTINKFGSGVEIDLSKLG